MSGAMSPIRPRRLERLAFGVRLLEITLHGSAHREEQAGLPHGALTGGRT
jgi:hypothetical protein